MQVRSLRTRGGRLALSTQMIGVISVASLCLIAAHSAKAEKALIHVFINQKQENGRAWHGFGAPIVGPFILQSPNEAPGAVLCVVTKDGKANCIRSVDNRLRSPCPESYDCDFHHVDLPQDEVFGILVLDPAMVFIHLVDAVVFTRSGLDFEDPTVLEMDKTLRAAAENLAPPTPQERQRRSRPFPVMSFNDCDPACTLRQSRLLLAIEKAKK